MKIRCNPILKKELKIGSRSIKLPMAIAGYALVLSLIAYFIMTTMTRTYYYGGGYSPVDYSSLANGFLLLSYTQITIICLMIPIITASSIAGEREKQTLDIMLTAPISSVSIVTGKLFTALINVFMFIIASLPAMSVCFLYGGIEWQQLITFVLASLIIGFFVGAIGVWCSSVFKKTVVSVIMTLVLEGVFFIVPAVIFLWMVSRTYLSIFSTGTSSQMSLGIRPLIIYLDPAIGYVESLQSATSSYDILDLFNITDAKMAPIVTATIPYYKYISMIITILMGCIFIFLSAKKIDAPRSKSKKREVDYGQANQEIHN